MPNAEAWISSKKINENSIHDKLKTAVNASDGKIKINFSDNYQYISHGNLNLVIKHISSGVKVAFIAATKVYKVHEKAVLSVAATSENALAVSSCEGDKLLVWDSRTGENLYYKILFCMDESYLMCNLHNLFHYPKDGLVREMFQYMPI